MKNLSLITVMILFGFLTLNAQSIKIVKDSTGKEMVTGMPKNSRIEVLAKSNSKHPTYFLLLNDSWHFRFFYGKLEQSMSEDNNFRTVLQSDDHGHSTSLETKIGYFYFPEKKEPVKYFKQAKKFKYLAVMTRQKLIYIL